MSSADDHADKNNNVKNPIVVIESEQKDNGDDLAGSSDNSKEIFNHPGAGGKGKARSDVWKVFGFHKKKSGPPSRDNLDMTKAVCRICRKEYINKGLYFTIFSIAIIGDNP